MNSALALVRILRVFIPAVFLTMNERCPCCGMLSVAWVRLDDFGENQGAKKGEASGALDAGS